MRDHAARWATAPSIELTPPPGEGWSAWIDLELRTSDGGVTSLTTEVELWADTTTEHLMVAPATFAVEPGTVGLLVGYVRFESAGLRHRQLGVGGRVVEVSETGFLASARRFAPVIGDDSMVVFEDHVRRDLEVE